MLVCFYFKVIPWGILYRSVMDDQKHFPSAHLLANDTEHQGGRQLNMTL